MARRLTVPAGLGAAGVPALSEAASPSVGRATCGTCQWSVTSRPAPFVTRYLVIKQDNDGDTFLISQADPAELLDHAADDQVTPMPIGARSPTDPDELAWRTPELPDLATINSTEPAF